MESEGACSYCDEVSEDSGGYCVCGGDGGGRMVQCDRRDACGSGRSWFHLECVGLREFPPPGAAWLCPDCRAQATPRRSPGVAGLLVCVKYEADGTVAFDELNSFKRKLELIQAHISSCEDSVTDLQTSVETLRERNNKKRAEHLLECRQLAKDMAALDLDLRPGLKPSHPLYRDAVSILKEWLSTHLDNPYPTRQEKEQLMAKTGLDATQVNNWLLNCRRRTLEPFESKPGPRKKGS